MPACNSNGCRWCLQRFLKEHFDERILACQIGGPIITKANGQGAFQLTVGCGLRGVGTQVVPQRQMAAIFLALWRTHIEMVGGAPRRSCESFAPRNAKVATVGVSGGSQSLDNKRQA